MTGYACRYPLAFGIVPDVPLVSCGNPALVAKDETHVPEELIDVEFQRFGEPQFVAIEVDIICKVLDRWHKGVVAVVHPLRRPITYQVIVPQRIGIGSAPSNPIHGGIATQRWRRLIL